MADIFFSYSQKDEQRVRPIISALEAQDYTVWWDTHIDGGARWRAKIKTELTGARCAIVAWSALSAASDFVTDEAQLANRADKLVPLLLEPMEPPLGFGGLQALDFSRWSGKPEALEFVKLCNAVRAKLGEPLKPLPILRPQPRWRAVAIGLSAVAGVATLALSLWFFYEPRPPPLPPDIPGTPTSTPTSTLPPDRVVSDDEWRKGPDNAYCFQRDHKVRDGQFIARCFQTNELCSKQRPDDILTAQDERKVTSCTWTSGLLRSSAWKGAKPDGFLGSWHKYSDSPFPLPFSQF